MTQPGEIRVARANFLGRIRRLCFADGLNNPGLPAPQAVTFYDSGAGARLDFDTVADAELWVDRHEMAEVQTPQGTHAYLAMVHIDGVYTELVVWRNDVESGPVSALSRCEFCHQAIEYVDVQDPFWRHVDVVSGPAHGANPKPVQP